LIDPSKGNLGERGEKVERVRREKGGEEFSC
jgi:hypothetical protein